LFSHDRVLFWSPQFSGSSCNLKGYLMSWISPQEEGSQK
jgi:hypothetical protein